jgi:hypothetical protein
MPVQQNARSATANQRLMGNLPYNWERSGSYEIVRDLYKVVGKPAQATVDTDVLVEMYLVNGQDKKLFVRDFVASVELDGVRRELERKDDFFALEISGRRYEYALQRNESDNDKEPLSNLSRSIRAELEPQKPLEGWVRFMVEDILPEKLENNQTYRISVIDSLGREHPILKASQKKRDGQVAIRLMQPG